jgi:hypothetical protein
LFENMLKYPPVSQQTNITRPGAADLAENRTNRPAPNRLLPLRTNRPAPNRLLPLCPSPKSLVLGNLVLDTQK